MTVRNHFKIFFECEKSGPVQPASCSGDKAYLKIRREAKQLAGATDRLCSRKGVLK